MKLFLLLLQIVSLAGLLQAQQKNYSEGSNLILRKQIGYKNIAIYYPNETNMDEEENSNPLLYLAVSLGSLSGQNENAIDGFKETKFEIVNPVLMGSLHLVITRINNKLTDLAVGVKYSSNKMNLSENGIEFGMLESKPIIGSIRLQRRYTNSFFYFDFDLGSSSNSFNKGSGIKALENYYSPAKIEVTVESSFIWAISFGAGFNFSKNIMIFGQIEIGENRPETSWYAVNQSARIKIDDFKRFINSFWGFRGGLMLAL